MKRDRLICILFLMHLIVFSNIWSHENETEHKKKTPLKVKNYKILFKQDKKFNQTSRGSSTGGKKSAVMPSFDRPNENLTVVIGNEAVLPCFINNLGDHKVAWIKVANMDILAIGDYKVTNDDRIRLLHGYVSDWSLSIQTVNEEDAGEYICQINTEPQIITRINLEVLLPPKIIEEKSSLIPRTVKEGDSISLYCHAEGIPIPNVSWYYREKSLSSLDMISNRHFKRHDRNKNERLKVEGRFIQEGTLLNLKDLSRSNSGIYECIANNSVPPAASRKIKIMVEFPPEVYLENDNLEYTIGQEARLECKITAHPLTNHYWMKNGHVIDNLINGANTYGINSIKNENRRSLFPRTNEIDFSSSQVSDSKYEILIYDQNTIEYSLISALIIKNLTTSDFGAYECYAVNTHNTSKAEGELIEIRRPTTSKQQKGSRILVFDSSKNDQNQINHLNKNFMNENGRVKNLLNKEYSLTTNLAKLQRKRFNLTIKARPIGEDDYSSEESSWNPFNRFNSSSNNLRQLVKASYVLKYFVLFIIFLSNQF